MADFVIVPDNFGTGNSGLTPNNSQGTPWLGNILEAQQAGQNIVAQAADGPPDTKATVIIVDSSGGTVDIELPTAVGNTGRTITIKRIGANNVTITPDGSEELEGAAAAITLATTLFFRTIISDGVAWHVIGNN